jgi:hypothetical protein
MLRPDKSRRSVYIHQLFTISYVSLRLPYQQPAVMLKSAAGTHPPRPENAGLK